MLIQPCVTLKGVMVAAVEVGSANKNMFPLNFFLKNVEATQWEDGALVIGDGIRKDCGPRNNLLAQFLMGVR